MTIIYDPNQPIYTQAYDEVRPELEAMPQEQVEPIRHDIMAATIVALGAVPNVARLRAAVASKFGEAAARQIDRLPTVARACGKAHALHLTTLHGTDVEEMAGRLGQTRNVLTLEAQALVAGKVLSRSVLGELVGGTSYKALCLDVLQLVSALRHAWAEVSAHTGVTSLELDQAEALANAFSTTLGENEQGTAGSPTGDMRRRAYTLFVTTYGEVRRFVTYFRWEAGDADELAPPLGSSRVRRNGDVGDESDDGAEPGLPIAVDGAVSPPVVSPTPAPAPIASPAAPTPPTSNGAPVRPGMPGAPPFGPT